MKPRSACILVCLIVSISALNLFAGSSLGIFASVEKIVLEPDATSPQKIQIWGTFVIPVSASSGSYQDPQRGYLYFSVPPGKEDIAREEWNDIISVAGKNQTIGFGDYWVAKGQTRVSLEVRVRKDFEPPTAPEVYPIAIGVSKINRPLAQLTKQQLSDALPLPPKP